MEDVKAMETIKARERRQEIRNTLEHLEKDHGVKGLSPISEHDATYLKALHAVHAAKEYQHDLTTGWLHKPRRGRADGE